MTLHGLGVCECMCVEGMVWRDETGAGWEGGMERGVTMILVQAFLM
jgi:hypothetical protein